FTEAEDGKNTQPKEVADGWWWGGFARLIRVRWSCVRSFAPEGTLLALVVGSGLAVGGIAAAGVVRAGTGRARGGAGRGGALGPGRARRGPPPPCLGGAPRWGGPALRAASPPTPERGPGATPGRADSAATWGRVREFRK